MSDVDPFPILRPSSLSIDDVVQYLLALKSAGHSILRHPKQKNVFFIVLDELRRIRISINAERGGGQIQLLHCENATHFLDVSSLVQLQNTVATFARQATGREWPRPPTSGRLDAATPATNFRSISQLVGSRKLEAVFNPYLDNGSLVTLKHILSYGDGEVASGVRLLSGSPMRPSQVPKFTKAGVDAWLNELGIQGEARLMATKEHRRFLLLSGGSSLLLGHSLNAIHKNEAIHLEPDDQDRAFFESAWATAISLT